jgi:chromate transporter
MLLPGPEAQQLAIYIGWLLHRTWGGVVAGVLFIVPGLIVILGLSIAYALLQETTWLDTVFFGLKAAVLAIVIEAVLRVGKRALKKRPMFGIAAGAFIALYVFHLPFPLIVLGAAIIGYFGAKIRPGLFVGGGHGASADAAIEDHLTAVQPSWRRALTVVAVCGALWASLPALLIGIFGWDSVYAPISVFFSEMAVVTFGGAYAVLAYVAQQAVETFGWLQPGEMLDGLAMAETTPGPLIMVLTYVGFLAGFREASGLSPLGGGLLAAVLATWVTFVPCFLWIFLGAPYVERLRGNQALSGALAAITAGVVGVILNLAIWFGLHVLFASHVQYRLGPAMLELPRLSSIDGAAAVLSAAAMLAMLRFKVGVLPTLAGCAAAGAVWRLLF